MPIENYSFGKITIDGVSYTNDIIILNYPKPLKVIPNWWRKEGHKLQLIDLEKIKQDLPEILIVGTGASECMQVTKEVLDFAKKNKIELVILGTHMAYKKFNEFINSNKKVCGCLHLTC